MTGNVVNPSPSLLSRQKVELMKAFECAKSIDDTVKAFKELERYFDESDLGMECWILAHKILEQENDIDIDFENGLFYGKKALRILLANVDKNKPCFGKYLFILNTCSECGTSSYFISCVCNLLGKASFKLKRYDESVSYLNWATRNFTKLEELEQGKDKICSRKCFSRGLLESQLELYWIKRDKGKHGEAAVHTRNMLGVKEKLMEKDCIELGEANRDVYMAYCTDEDFKQALPFCLKALEIHEKHLGRDSDVVAEIMNSLGIIYKQLGEYEKAKGLGNGLSRKASKNMVSSTYGLLMSSGKYEEAVSHLEGEVSRDDISNDRRASLFLSMAGVYIKLGKFTDAKKRIRIAKNIFEKKGIDPSFVAIGFGEISCLYEDLNDPETALSFVRRAVAVPNVLRPILLQNASRLFSLTSRSHNVKEGIPYLEDTVEKIKASLGPKHFQVGYGYTNLGLAYFNSGQQELGVKFMKDAKDIMDATFGPNHINSLRISQTLSSTYASMGRYLLAIDIQEKIVEGLKGSREQEFMDEAVTHLNGMKVGALKSQLKDGEYLCETISKCGISG